MVEGSALGDLNPKRKDLIFRVWVYGLEGGGGWNVGLGARVYQNRVTRTFVLWDGASKSSNLICKSC